MNQEKIGKFIAECRRKKNLTQQELASLLGVSDRTVGNWENGRNMPDISLFKPLCKELGITINDLISGEVVNEKDYKEKLEENIVKTLDYSEKWINRVTKNIGYIFVILGIMISVAAFTIFNSDSSWGSIYGILGGIIALVGVSKLTKKLQYIKRLIINCSFFLAFMTSLIILDFITVLTIKQAPRFSYLKITGDNVITYKALFYTVYRVNYDTDNEYYIIDYKHEYPKDNIPISPFKRDKSGISNIIKYKNKYVGNNSNTGGLIDKLPLAEYGYTFIIDDANLGLTINYNITGWYINEDYYLEKSLVYNSISLFLLIDNLEYIKFNFSGDSYEVTKKKLIELFPNYSILKDKPSELIENFNKYVEPKMNDINFIKDIFDNLFIN